MAQPTAFPELNAVLEEVMSSARVILGANFVGAYLQGSFAVGDADEHSDVDFLVVVERELTEAERRELQALQERVFAQPSQWAQHLEGSYVPRGQLRRLDPERRPWFYFDNGATEPDWDNHDNTAVVRWSLREHGIVLDGPDPKDFVEPVSADDLRAGALWALEEWEEWLPTHTSWSARFQPDAVIAYCRILQTFETGQVGSKPEAAAWALGTLDPEWHGLIRQARAERPDPWVKVGLPADPESVERTRAFAAYCSRVAREGVGTPPATR